MLLNDGSGTLLPPVAVASGRGPFTLEAADVDCDGRWELFTGNLVDDSVTSMANQGSLVFGSPAVVSTGTNPATFVVDDLDGDGSPDYAVPYQEGVTYGTSTCPADACLVATTAPTRPRGTLVAHGVRPNPFNPRTRFEFELARPATVSIDVYDAAGRHVRRLAPSGDPDAGRHGVAWDGRDPDGEPVASGVYLYRIVVDGAPAGRGRLTLLK